MIEVIKNFSNDDAFDLTCLLVTYNHEKSIRKCIESVLEQKTSYRVLIKILDDYSNDGTFKICLEYAMKFPDKIEIVRIKKNTKCKALPASIECLKTKYFCILDGDDYWCDDNKIQTMLDILETHPEYIMAGHNTNLYYISTNKTEPIVKTSPQNNLITLENYQYLHMSSLIYRTELMKKKQYKKMRKRDIFIYFAYLENGKCFYIDKIMSVYNITGEGTWTKLPNIIKQYAIRCLRPYACNRLSNYKFDVTYTKQVNKKTLNFMKKYFGEKIGWFLFYLYMKLKVYRKLNSKDWKEIRRIEDSYCEYSRNENKTVNIIKKEMENNGRIISCV